LLLEGARVVLQELVEHTCGLLRLLRGHGGKGGLLKLPLVPRVVDPRSLRQL
jgi:hypothetical protein